MSDTYELKLKLIETVIGLPDDKLFKVANYLAGLKGPKNGDDSAAQDSKTDYQRDPILKFIGLFDDGSLPSTSAEIDELLYGGNLL